MGESAVSTSYQYEPMPFPFNKTTFCRYEPIEKKINSARVLIVNDLLRYDTDLSELAKDEWNGTAEQKLRFERKISGMACDNIAKNVQRLVKNPKVLTVHLSEITGAVEQFRPDAIVMSGTLSDFDYYNPEQLATFAEFIQTTTLPVLGICGAHQLISMAFGGSLTTLDDLSPAEKRTGRINEHQYRFVKVIDKADPIFDGIADLNSGK